MSMSTEAPTGRSRKQEREWLADTSQMIRFLRKQAILARYVEKSEQEDQEIRSGRTFLTRRGDPGGPRRYPPGASAQQMMAAVGTDFVFDPSTITEEMEQDYLDACRRAAEAKQATIQQNLDAGLAHHLAKTTCELCGHRVTDQWEMPVTQLRDDLQRRLCAPCVRTVAADLEARERADLLPDGRTRGEASKDLVNDYLRSQS